MGLVVVAISIQHGNRATFPCFADTKIGIGPTDGSIIHRTAVEMVQRYPASVTRWTIFPAIAQKVAQVLKLNYNYRDLFYHVKYYLYFTDKSLAHCS